MELTTPFYLGEDIDVLQGGFLFSVRVPLSPVNEKLLGFPQFVENANRFLKNKTATIVVQGVDMLSGILEVVESQKQEVSIRLIVNALAPLKETPLSTIDMGTLPENDLLDHANDTLLNPDDFPYIFFTVHDTIFSQEADTVREFQAKEYQNRYVPAGFNGISVNRRSALTPFLKLNYVIEKIFASQGYRVFNNFQNTRELQWLCLYSARNLYQLNYISIEPYSVDLQNLKLNRHVSETPAAQFIKNVCRTFGVAPFANIFEQTVSFDRLDDVIAAAPAHDWTTMELKGYKITERDVDIESLKAAETLSNFPDFSQLPSVATNGSAIPYNDRDYIYKTPDGRDYLFENGGTETVNDRIVRIYPDDTVNLNAKKDKVYTTPFRQVNSQLNRIRYFGKADDEYISSGGIKFLSSVTPTLDLKSCNAEGKNVTPDALIFFRGMKSYPSPVDVQPPQYSCPLATNDIDFPFNIINPEPVKVGFDVPNPPPQYAPVLAKHTMAWNGENGLYNRFWKNTVDFIRTQRHVSKSVQLSVADIRNFQFNQKVTIGNMNYIVKKMKIVLTSQGLQPTEVDLVTCV